MSLDPNLLEYSDPAPRQREYFNAVLKHGSNIKAAKALGVDRRSVDRAIETLKKKAAKRGYAPDYGSNHPVPPGFQIKGESTLYDAEGNVKLTWVKSANDIDLEELSEAIREGFLSEIKGKAKKVKKPVKTLSDRLTVYGIGDAHCGLYAWEKEAGENFDLTIWEKDLISAMRRLIEATDATEEAMIVNVGDFIHSDTIENVTRRSGNPLDVDGRWAKVVKTAVMAMRLLIDLALIKHKKVTVINAQGNHDDQSSVFLTIALQQYYEREPRVEIQDTISKFHHYIFGKNLIAVTHTDTVKIPELESVMAAMWPEAWGQTEYRYWLVGHYHHKVEQEFRGCHVTMLRSLVAKDAWHAAHGYMAQREMVAITYHKEYGEEYRNVCSLKMARAA